MTQRFGIILLGYNSGGGAVMQSQIRKLQIFVMGHQLPK